MLFCSSDLCNSGKTIKWLSVMQHVIKLLPTFAPYVIVSTPKSCFHHYWLLYTVHTASLYVSYPSMFLQQTPLCLQYVHVAGVAEGETLGWIHNTHLSTRDGHSACPLVMMIGCNDTLHTVPVPQLFRCRSFFLTAVIWLPLRRRGRCTELPAALWER